MRDLVAYITQTYKTALADACQKHGIDHKTEAGYWIGGIGSIGPVIADGEMQGFAPTWIFGLSLRSKLLGTPVIGGQLPIHNIIPPDEEIKATAERLVLELESKREAQFRGEQ